MSQEETNQIVKALLFNEDDIDYLAFNVNGKNHKLDLNDEDNQEQIKKMFCDLVEQLEASDVKIELEVAEGYDNTLLREVSANYIDDLNSELDTVRTNITDDSI